jgi:hypothetical protein
MYPNNNCEDCSQCPTEVTPLPLPDLSELCGDYNAACVIYTGEDIPCLGIETGMTFLEVIDIFNNILPGCNCCAPVDCVVSDWGPWGECECYYEDELLVCGQQTRTRTVITPASNGGEPCGALTETRPCTIDDVCFTFGSDECENAPNPTQITESPAGLYNDKPYYEITTCVGSPVRYLWYDVDTERWRFTTVLGELGGTTSTLNNNDNYLPISNNTTETWSNGTLISSQFAPCPTVKICFKVKIDVDGDLFTYYFNVAPDQIDGTGYPTYSFGITTPLTDTYAFTVSYSGLVWEFQSSFNGGSFEIMSIMDLAETPYYPIGSSTDWTSTDPSPILVMSSYGACVQPPDVDCIWTCTDWSTCNASCTQTRTCTITTPASGNGTCGPSPALQQSCCTPSCGQPISPIVGIDGANVLITFSAVAGAVEYTLTYSSDGVSYTSIISSLPSFSFPWVCGLTYSGWIVTNCSTLNSVQTPFSITIPACPEPQFCNGDPLAFISGVFNNPQQVLLKINASAAVDGTKPVLTGLSPVVNNPIFMTNELGKNGIFLGGQPNISMNDGFGSYMTGGVLKLKCNSTSSLFFGEIDRTFIGISSGQGFSVGPGSTDVCTIHAIKYYAATNRIYVGGRFDKYKGVTCSSNLVCLDADTGNILPNTTFKIGTAGLNYSGGGGSPCVLDIQIDNTNPAKPLLVVAGAFNNYTSNTNISRPVHNIVRLNMDGTVDTTFNINATSFSTQQSSRDNISTLVARSFVKTVYIDEVGDIYAGGGFFSYKTIPAYNIVKIKSDGSIADVSEFDSGNGFLTPDGGLGVPLNTGWAKPYLGRTLIYSAPTQYGVSIEKIIPHVGGLLITGNFAYYNSDDPDSNRANGLIRINVNGTRDTSFTIDNTTVLPFSANSAIGRCGYDITVLEDNRILFGGYLTSYLGSTPSGSKGYYVLNSDGTVDSLYSISSSLTYLYIKTIASYFL